MFKIGETYSKEDIYRLRNVPKEKQKGSWNTGYTKFENDIFIFTNIGVPGRTGHDYNNHWENEDLVWYAKTGTNIDQPLIKEMVNGSLNVFIFTRDDSRLPFTFSGKAHIKSVLDESPVKIVWSFTKPEIINVKTAWQILIKNARAVFDSKESFFSPKENHEYTVVKVNPDSIRLKRLTVQSQSEEDLSYDTFKSVISRINNKEGQLSRYDTYNTVMIETAIVWLLPMLDWNDDITKVIVINSSYGKNAGINQYMYFKEARNDIDIRKISRELRLRRGQNKLRENLLYLYQNKCCITGSGIKQVLHACHILPHSETGINLTTNALLLRSDIHDLFDSNLIGIDPKSLIVRTNKSLCNTEYNKLDGLKLYDRVDGSSPDKGALKYRWKLFSTIHRL